MTRLTETFRFSGSVTLQSIDQQICADQGRRQSTAPGKSDQSRGRMVMAWPNQVKDMVPLGVRLRKGQAWQVRMVYQQQQGSEKKPRIQVGRDDRELYQRNVMGQSYGQVRSRKMGIDEQGRFVSMKFIGSLGMKPLDDPFPSLIFPSPLQFLLQFCAFH